MNKDGINMLSTLVLEQSQFPESAKKEARLLIAVVQQAINDLKYIGNEEPDLKHIGEDARDFLSNENRVGPYLQYLGINHNWFKRKLDVLLSLG